MQAVPFICWVNCIESTQNEHECLKKSLPPPTYFFMINGDTHVSAKECEIVYAQTIVRERCSNILTGYIEVKHPFRGGKKQTLSYPCATKWETLEKLVLSLHMAFKNVLCGRECSIDETLPGNKSVDSDLTNKWISVVEFWVIHRLSVSSLY